jgi:serine phosphatase RsbU (regulator of sigma subunit)
MDEARLVVPQPGGFRTVAVAHFPFRLGRNHENELVFSEANVSRHHAEILQEGERYFLVDTGSSYGTFLNGTRIEREPLVHGDHIQLGALDRPALEFQLVSAEMSTGRHEIQTERTLMGNGGSAAAAAAIASGPPKKRGPMDLLGQALRAMVEGRVLEEVLAIVVDHAVELAGAERGFVMLANADGELTIRMARGKNRQTLPGRDFQHSKSVPKEVQETGRLKYENEVPATRGTVIDLKIQSILCAPLPRVRSSEFETGDAAAQARAHLPMGVLYVDSPGLGRLESAELHSTFEQLAAEAAVAIENARLVRDSEEKSRLERELRVAAEIQRALLPPRRVTSGPIELAGTMIPCRAIGGDFYEYIEIAEGHMSFALCDVSGKGPGAALLAAAIQGILGASADGQLGPAEAMERLNRTMLRRSVERRFATIAYGMIDPAGRLRLVSAGHNPAYVVHPDGSLSKLDKGGLMVGAFPGLSYDEDEVMLSPGDRLVLYSDGVTEAEDPTTAQFEEERLEACLRASGALSADGVVECVIETVRAFASGYAQADDMTVLVVGYVGATAPAS